MSTSIFKKALMKNYNHWVTHPCPDNGAGDYWRRFPFIVQGEVYDVFGRGKSLIESYQDSQRKARLINNILGLLDDAGLRFVTVKVSYFLKDEIGHQYSMYVKMSWATGAGNLMAIYPNGGKIFYSYRRKLDFMEQVVARIPNNLCGLYIDRLSQGTEQVSVMGDIPF